MSEDRQACEVRGLGRMRRPCDPSDKSGACPFRRDADPGEFSAERFEQLAGTAGRPGEEAPLNAPIFACHHTAEGKEVACAGWLAVVGQHHLGVRLATAMGRIDPAALQPGEGWPELFTDYDAMAAAQTDGEYDPELAAERRAEVGHMVWMGRPGDVP